VGKVFNLMVLVGLNLAGTNYQYNCITFMKYSRTTQNLLKMARKITVAWNGEPYENQREAARGAIKFKHGFDGEKFWAEIISIGGKSPEEFKQILSSLQQTGLSYDELKKVISLAGSLNEDEMNFQTRWETTDEEGANEANIQGERSPDLSSVLRSLDWYNPSSY
jgi:hypothetical protein